MCKKGQTSALAEEVTKMQAIKPKVDGKQQNQEEEDGSSSSDDSETDVSLFIVKG